MNVSIYPEFNQASVTVLKAVTIKYNERKYAMARQDARHGQCKFSRKFFENPQVTMLAILGNRHISNMGEWRELTEKQLDEAVEESMYEYGESGYSCPVNFADYLMEVVETAFN
jgi:hypothetical protein